MGKIILLPVNLSDFQIKCAVVGNTESHYTISFYFSREMPSEGWLWNHIFLASLRNNCSSLINCLFHPVHCSFPSSLPVTWNVWWLHKRNTTRRGVAERFPIDPVRPKFTDSSAKVKSAQNLWNKLNNRFVPCLITAVCGNVGVTRHSQIWGAAGRKTWRWGWFLTRTAVLWALVRFVPEMRFLCNYDKEARSSKSMMTKCCIIILL